MDIIKWANKNGQTLRLGKEERRILVRALKEARYLQTVTIVLDGLITEIEIT